jgi:hypothetical protein
VIFPKRLSTQIFIKEFELDVVSHTCNLSTQETEAGRFRVEGQPGLHTRTQSQKKVNPL